MRERFDCEGVGGVEVQVFFEAVGVEEIVAGPASGYGGSLAGSKSRLMPSPELKTTKRSSDFLSRSKTSP